MISHIKKQLQFVVFSLFLSVCLPTHAGSYDDYFIAITRDNPSPLAELQTLGFDFNTPDPALQPPLVLAIRKESWRVVDFLLNLPRLDWDARNPAGENALMLAAIKGEPKVVQRLLAHQAQVNQPGWAPLHYAVSHVGAQAVPITRLLLEHHAYIDAASPNGSTPLMMAARYGQAEVVRLLLDEGADPLLRNDLGLNAIDFARQTDRPDIAEAIAGAVRNQQPKGQW